MNRSVWLSLLDAILVGSAFASLIALHEHGPIPEQEKFLLMLLVPIAYVLSSSLFARTNLAVAASRAYLLYLCTAIAGAGLITIGLVQELGQVIELPADQMLDRVQGIVESGAQIIPRLILPIVCGVGLYAFSSVFEKTETSHPNVGLGNARGVESLVASLRKMNVPEQLSTVLTATVSSVVGLNTQCNSLKSVVTNLQQAVHSLESTTTSTGRSFEKLRGQAEGMSEQLIAMRSDGILTQQQVAIIARSVSEMKKVLDEFAELASHEILAR